MKELTFQEGLEESKGVIESVEERPILVAIYGRPNSGKTYLIHKLRDYFKQKGLEAGAYGGAPRASDFEHIRDNPGWFMNSLILYHCGWDREDLRMYDHEDPTILTKGVLNRNINLNIGMYNPNFYSKPRGEYDLIISNPASTKKRPF